MHRTSLSTTRLPDSSLWRPGAFHTLLLDDSGWENPRCHQGARISVPLNFASIGGIFPGLRLSIPSTIPTMTKILLTVSGWVFGSLFSLFGARCCLKKLSHHLSWFFSTPRNRVWSIRRIFVIVGRVVWDRKKSSKSIPSISAELSGTENQFVF